MKKKVLIVDDQSMIRKLVNMTIQSNVIEIIEANNGEDALTKVEKLLPDLILLDIMMPGEVDGIGICHIIKNQEHLKHIPIIFLTAKTQQIDIEEGLFAGADDYMLKPFSPEVLRSKCYQYLNNVQ